MANEKVLVDRWLYNLLSTDAPLMALTPGGVWGGLMPPPIQLQQDAGSGVPYPAVLFNMQSAKDQMVINASRVMVSMQYLVKAVDAVANQDTIAAIADRIDVLLHRVTATYGGIAILNCWREAPVAYVELDSGTYFRHLGGLYNLQAQ